MKLLGFVNWKALDAGFRWLMWLVAGVLAVLILLHAVPGRTSENGAARTATPPAQTATAATHAAALTPRPRDRSDREP